MGTRRQTDFTERAKQAIIYKGGSSEMDKSGKEMRQRAYLQPMNVFLFLRLKEGAARAGGWSGAAMVEGMQL